MNVVTNFSDLDLSKTYTYADYLLWQFDERVELIKGFIRKMSPAPNRYHQTVSMNVTLAIGKSFYKQPCKFYAAPFDVRLPIKSAKKDTTIVQPDLCVICDVSKLDTQGCNGAPDLIIEILSPKNSKHDYDTKFKLYQESGVKEYWIVETEEKIVLVYTLQNGKYVGLAPKTIDNIIESPLFPDLQISCEEVFYGI